MGCKPTVPGLSRFMGRSSVFFLAIFSICGLVPNTPSLCLVMGLFLFPKGEVLLILFLTSTGAKAAFLLVTWIQKDKVSLISGDQLSIHFQMLLQQSLKGTYRTWSPLSMKDSVVMPRPSKRTQATYNMWGDIILGLQ